MTQQIIDAQTALSHVLHQRSHIEAVAFRREYPEIKYSQLVPIDTSANEFSASVTHFSIDSEGKAKFVNGKANDVPLVNLTSNKFEQTVKDGGIGYAFSRVEIGTALLMGQNLSTDGALAARETYERFVDEIALEGEEGIAEGLFNHSGVAVKPAAQTFSGSTPIEILTEINDALSLIHEQTKGIGLPNTIVLPIAVRNKIATTPMSVDSSMTILDYLRKSNIFTAETGNEIKIAASFRLTNRMLVYKRDDSVLKMHIPMPLQFIEPQVAALSIKTYGMFRLAPIQIRQPKALLYVDGVA